MIFEDYYFSNNGLTTCNKCVMDLTDPDINLNSEGLCNYCANYEKNISQLWYRGDQGHKKLFSLFNNLKSTKGRYDCIMGLSGGVDSSYLAILLKKYNVNPLVVHVDAGWNSEIAVSNIEKIVNHCNFDLHTHVVNWDSIKRLQLAYLKSGLSNQDVPQDHVFFAVLHKQALKQGCKVFISGGNVASEYIFPRSWHGDAMDSINLNDVWKKHGDGKKLVGYETISFTDYKILFHRRGFRQVRPLNCYDYSVGTAVKELEGIGWRNYGMKHGESLFTRLFQNYILPKRFGFDKRRPHLSSRILAGEITRDYALEILSKPLYLKNDLEQDVLFFCNKLGVDINFFDSCLKLPKKYYNEYRNWDGLNNFYSKLSRMKKTFLIWKS